MYSSIFYLSCYIVFHTTISLINSLFCRSPTGKGEGLWETKICPDQLTMSSQVGQVDKTRQRIQIRHAYFMDHVDVARRIVQVHAAGNTVDFVSSCSCSWWYS